MVDFSFNISANLKFGIDIINRIGNIVSQFGEKAILITEGILHESGIINRIADIIKKKNCQIIIFDDVIPNATSDIAEYGAEIARSSYVDVVIGLGGIRTLCIAKAIAMLARNDRNIFEYTGENIPENDSLPYIEIPSTPRNPFMFRDELWLVNAKNRSCEIIKVKKDTTKFVLFDPILTTSLPRRFIATTTIYTLSNAIEGYLSKTSNFFSDTLFLKAIEILNDNIFQSVNTPDDMVARANLSLGGLFTCMGLNMSYTGIANAVSLVLSSKYRIHKSLSTPIILPHTMEFNITAAPLKFVKIAEALKENIDNLNTLEASMKAIEKLRKIIIKLQLPSRLEEFDINKDDLISIADDARKLEMFNYIPRSCSSEELYEILLSSY